MTFASHPQSLDDYMQRTWITKIAPDPDGGVALTAWPLQDFVVYGETEEQVLDEWRDALRSHLAGYLACGKAIPFVRIDLAGLSTTRASTIMPDDSLALT